jgi:folate-dependent phosphoribosylglycinamide formyltransferase PurN
MTSRKRVAVLISGAGSNMAALIDAAGHPDAPFEVVLVLSNKPEAGGLAVADAKGVPTAVVDHAPSARTARRTNRRSRLCWKPTTSRSWPSPAICAC